MSTNQHIALSDFSHEVSNFEPESYSHDVAGSRRDDDHRALHDSDFDLSNDSGQHNFNGPEQNDHLPEADEVDSASEELSSKERWRQAPQPLGKLHFREAFSLALDVTMMLLPFFFVLLSGAALYLNGKPRSNFGDNIIEASKYGTTAFPFIFTAVIARLLRAIAQWKCERGAKVIILEQLVGSQSLGSSLGRFLSLGQYNFVAFALLALWAISPFGSQMTLRLLELIDSETFGTRNVSYLDLKTGGRDVGITAFDGASDLSTFHSAVTALIGTSFLASESVLQSPVDQWGSVKIPYVQDLPADGSWLSVDTSQHPVWTSLSGVVTLNLSKDEISNMIIHTTFLNVSCPDSVSILLPLNQTDPPAPTGYPIVTQNLTGTSNFLARLNESNTEYNNTTVETLVYGSFLDFDHTIPDEIKLDLFNCTVESPQVDANLSCHGQACAVTHLRYSADDGESRYLPFANVNEYSTVLDFTAASLGLSHPGSLSPTDKYVMGADNPFTTTFDSVQPSYQNISGSFVAKRLTTLLNTVWQASLCPLALTFGSNANLSACFGPQSDSGRARSAPTTANTRRAIPLSVYRATVWHAVALLVISSLLLIAGIFAIILIALTKAPNLFGFVSGLIKDNPYVALPTGGSTLDGAERAKLLANMQIKIADVRAEEDVGYLAFCTEGGQYDQGFRGLQRGRLYA